MRISLKFASVLLLGAIFVSVPTITSHAEELGADASGIYAAIGAASNPAVGSPNYIKQSHKYPSKNRRVLNKNRGFRFDGVWQGSLFPVAGSCGVKSSIDVSHTVVQRSNSIALQVPKSNGFYTGEVDGSDGFIVAGSYTTTNGGCIVETAIRYFDANRKKAGVLVGQKISCRRGISCFNQMMGKVTRSKIRSPRVLPGAKI